MRAVLETLRSPGQPSDEDFVNAVIRTHERIRSKLRALGRDKAPRDAGGASEESAIIRAYFRLHGVETRRTQGDPCREPSWQAV
jgi:hypothetical protein